MHPGEATTGPQRWTARLWQGLDRHPIAVLSILYVVCVALFLGSIRLPRVDGQLTGSDGAFYYSYLPSLILDHDLDFGNQYAALVPVRDIARLPKSPDGRPHNQYAIGPAILWAPFFLAGHLLAIVLRAMGHPIPLDGLGYVYQVPTLFGSLTYGFAGLLLLYRSCCRTFSQSVSASAAILIWLATSLIYYMIAEPSMSHACSFFAAALFLNLWLSFRPNPTPGQWLLLGLSGGLIALVRQPDATWLALPALDLLLTAAGGRQAWPARYAKGFFIYGIAAAAAFLPQIIVWHILNGSIYRAGYTYALERAHFHWFSPKVLPLLFSLQHGLFSWHPLLLFAAAGLLFMYRKNRSLTLALSLIFASQIYVIGAWFGWSGGHSFGSRMLISSLPLLAFGLAALIEWMAKRRALPAVGLLGAAFIAWNALFFLQYRFGYIPKLGPITFYQLTLGKVAMLQDLPSRLIGMIQ